MSQAQHHVGLMVPINNTTMEKELLAWLPAGSRCDTRKIPRGQGLLTRETIPAYKAQALEIAKQFIDQPIELLAYGCTAASFLSGPEEDAALGDQLSRILGKPVVTTARAMVLALQAQRARRIALVTPYLDEVNQQLHRYLGQSGIEVSAFDTLRAADVHALGRITSAQVATMARQVMRADCDAMFIACSQLPTVDILAPLSREFGCPVLSSIQATAWRARQLLEKEN
jgi:maleate cis-trans isomerase